MAFPVSGIRKMASFEANPGDPEDSCTATFVTWSPLESRFAVGSGAQLVCYTESKKDLAVSKRIKKQVCS